MAKAVFRIEHRLGIPAPAHVIWQVLSDLASWGQWNPIYPKVEGRLTIGEDLAVTEQIPGFEPVQIAPTVVDWVPDAQILWLMSSRFGFLKRLRYFEIDPVGEKGCIFANGEDWYGRPARYVTAAQRRGMREGFEALSEALSARALAVWRDGPPAPTSHPG